MKVYYPHRPKPRYLRPRLSRTSAAPNARTVSQEVLPTAEDKFATTMALALASRTAKHRAQHPSVFLMLRNVAGQQIRSYHIIGTGRCRNDGVTSPHRVVRMEC
jgi:hypothetical protein